MINFISQNQEMIIILAIFILFIFLVWNIYLSYNLGKIKKRMRSFFAGSDAKDLEEILCNQIKYSNEVKKNIEEINKTNIKIKKDLGRCIQKVGVVRFNPFGDVGGNQSFAIALLDNLLNGVIVLSLYSRDRVKIYSKQIKEGRSEYILSKEEEEAIKIAEKMSN